MQMHSKFFGPFGPGRARQTLIHNIYRKEFGKTLSSLLYNQQLLEKHLEDANALKNFFVNFFYMEFLTEYFHLKYTNIKNNFIRINLLYSVI